MVNRDLWIAFSAAMSIYILLMFVFRKRIYRHTPKPSKWILAPLGIGTALLIFWPYSTTSVHDYVTGSLAFRLAIAVVVYGFLAIGVYLDSRGRKKANQKT